MRKNEKLNLMYQRGGVFDVPGPTGVLPVATMMMTMWDKIVIHFWSSWNSRGSNACRPQCR